MKKLFLIIQLLIISVPCIAFEQLNDEILNDITAQEGITVILENFKITQPGGTFSIGGTDGLGIPAAPDGAWFVFETTRTIQLDVEKGDFDIDVFTASSNLILGDHGDILPANTSAAVITFGEAYFHINNTEALFTLKFSNNPEGDETDGVVKFADTVCNFALNGSTIKIKSEDAIMYIFPH